MKNLTQAELDHHEKLHSEGVIIPHGLGVGVLHMRGGLLCFVDPRGRLQLAAPRKSDAARVVRAGVVAGAGPTDMGSARLAADVRPGELRDGS